MLLLRNILSISRFHNTLNSQKLSRFKHINLDELKESREKQLYEEINKKNKEHQIELSNIIAKVIGLKELVKQNELILSRLVSNNNKKYIKLFKKDNKPYPPVNSF